MDHYEVFTNEHEVLLGKLYDIYLAFYKTKKEFLACRAEFMAILEERFPMEYKKEEGNEENNMTVLQENKEVEEKVEKDTNIRTSTLFHKIALYAHPDKHNNINPVLFDQSVKASEKGKFGKLCFLAKFMNIPFVEKFTSEEIQMIKETIEKKEKKIQHYEKTYPMIYKKTKNPKIREQLIEAFYKTK
jgi:hypothetical protein